MRGYKSLILLLIILNVVACSSIEKTKYHAPGTLIESEEKLDTNSEFIDERYPVNVERVIDADTLVLSFKDPDNGPSFVNGERQITVRILGIDGPESTSKKQLWGTESAAFTEGLVSQGNVEVEVDEKAKSDKYGRYLFHVFVNGTNVAAESVKHGYSRVAYVFDDYKYIPEYRELEDKAREEKINIHSIPNYVTETGFDMSVVDSMEPEFTFEINGIQDIMDIVQESGIYPLFEGF